MSYLELYDLLCKLFPEQDIDVHKLVVKLNNVNLSFSLVKSWISVSLYNIYDIDGVLVDISRFISPQYLVSAVIITFDPSKKLTNMKSKIEAKIFKYYLQYIIYIAITGYRNSIVNDEHTTQIKSTISKMCRADFVGDIIKTFVNGIPITVILDRNQKNNIDGYHCIIRPIS